MIETKDLILDKGKVDEWKSMYENVWRHEETARYMMWSAKQTEQEGFEMTQGFIEFQKVNPTAYFVYEKKSKMPIGYAGMKETSKGVFEDSGIAVGPSYTGKGYGKRSFAHCLTKPQSVGFRFSHSEETIDRRSGKPFIMNYYER